MPQETLEQLRKQVHDLQVSKLELIRSTSTEIEKLRRIIRVLTNGNTNMEIVNSIKYEPLSKSEIPLIQNLMPISTRPSQEFRLQQLSQNIPYVPKQRQLNEEIQHGVNVQSVSPYVYYQTPGTNINNINNNANNTNNTTNNSDNTNNNINNNNNDDNNGNEVFSSINVNQELGTITEDETFTENHNNNNNNNNNNNLNTQQRISSKKSNSDSLFKLNTKRMSYQGFAFNDFGFITTDFDQLSRGHTQWINATLHHPVQNGVVISCSDDWCIMFWHFRKASGKEGLQQEKYDSLIKNEKNNNNHQHQQQSKKKNRNC